MPETSFYSTLGVEPKADPQVIKGAYRELAKQFHPDHNPGNTAAEEKFKMAANAYEVVGNEKKRALYDQYGTQWKAHYSSTTEQYPGFKAETSSTYTPPKAETKSQTNNAKADEPKASHTSSNSSYTGTGYSSTYNPGSYSSGYTNYSSNAYSNPFGSSSSTADYGWSGFSTRKATEKPAPKSTMEAVGFMFFANNIFILAEQQVKNQKGQMESQMVALQVTNNPVIFDSTASILLFPKEAAAASRPRDNARAASQHFTAAASQQYGRSSGFEYRA